MLGRGGLEDRSVHLDGEVLRQERVEHVLAGGLEEVLVALREELGAWARVQAGRSSPRSTSVLELCPATAPRSPEMEASSPMSAVRLSSQSSMGDRGRSSRTTARCEMALLNSL